MRRFGNNLLAALTGSAAAGLAIVLVESVLVSLWWGPAVIPPAALARTQMFDSLSELGLRLGPGIWVAASGFTGSVYPAGGWRILELAGGLAWGSVPWALILGIVAAAWCALDRRQLHVRSAALFVIACAGVVDVCSWAVSIHFPSRLTAYLAMRNIIRSLALDGEWVSLLTFVIATALFLTRRRGRRSFLVERSPRLGFAFLLVGTGVVVLFAGLAPARRVISGIASASSDQVADGSPVGLSGGQAPSRPNIVLISIDSLRADHLGCYGWKRDSSPNIDKLAASGTRFSAAWSTTSWTLPSHVSMLSGRSLLGHGVLENEDAIPASVPLLAEELKAAGYKTAGFVSAPYLSSSYGFARGFDLYDDKTVSFTSHKDSHSGVTSPKVHAAVQRWLQGEGVKGDRPFFLFVHYWDVHYDYAPPAPFDRMFDPDYAGRVNANDFVRNPLINARMAKRDLEHVVALYDGEIRFTDGYVGKLLRLLRVLGLSRNTVVILAADHGDEFFEHGNKAHQRTLYQEVLHVPLIISWPGVLAEGEVVTRPVSIMDIVPTVLALVGREVPPGVEGINLLKAGDREGNRVLVAELYRKSSLNLQVALREGPYKLIQSLNYPRIEFFNLASDPMEQRVTADDPQRALLSVKLERWLQGKWGEYARRQATEGHRYAVVTREHVEALRALGYVE